MKKINVLAVGDPATYVYKDSNNKFLQKFEEMTGICVQFDIVKWADYYTTLLNSFQTYKYDIVMIAGHLWLKEFVDQGYLLKLKGQFKENYQYEDILLSIRSEMELEGNLYLLPSFCDGHILVYRKSELKNKLSEVVSIDQLIKIVENNSCGQENIFVLKAHPSEIFLDFLPYLRSEGVDAFDEEGNTNINTKAGYLALKKYINMKQYCDKHVSEFGNEEVLDALQKKKCILGVSWGGQLGQIMNDQCMEPEDLGFAALETSWNVTWSFGINHLCKNQEQAALFLEFITSQAVDQVVGAYCGNPTRLSSFIAGKDIYRWYPVLLKMLTNAKPLPNLSNTGQRIGILTEQITKAFNNEIKVEEAFHGLNI
ncbi:MAG: sugar ABC transporter substrate-binding protein [Firmicutes bacterium HGW-Firmicutes-7]|nr:MAG: sugar ABC transporter substrate-binding protein [Firmicutes bacterium HGW-Firmicutes-7]